MANKCKIDNCDSMRHGQGYCNKHYARFIEYGDPLYQQTKTIRKDSSHEIYVMANKIFDKNIHKV